MKVVSQTSSVVPPSIAAGAIGGRRPMALRSLLPAPVSPRGTRYAVGLRGCLDTQVKDTSIFGGASL